MTDLWWTYWNRFCSFCPCCVLWVRVWFSSLEIKQQHFKHSCSLCLMYWYAVPFPLNHHIKSASLSFLPIKTQTHHHKHLNLLSWKEMWAVSFTQRHFKTTSTSKWHWKVAYFKPYNLTFSCYKTCFVFLCVTTFQYIGQAADDYCSQICAHTMDWTIYHSLTPSLIPPILLQQMAIMASLSVILLL